MRASGELTLKLRNTIDQDVIIAHVTDNHKSNIYFNLEITLPEGCPDGEYEYALVDENNVLSTGIMVLVSAETSNEYNKDIEYEQYKTE